MLLPEGIKTTGCHVTEIKRGGPEAPDGARASQEQRKEFDERPHCLVHVVRKTGDEQRLADGQATVTELTDHVDLSQPLVSWHLHRLKAAGVVETRRAGREVICTLSREMLDYFQTRERELLGLAG